MKDGYNITCKFSSNVLLDKGRGPKICKKGVFLLFNFSGIYISLGNVRVCSANWIVYQVGQSLVTLECCCMEALQYGSVSASLLSRPRPCSGIIDTPSAQCSIFSCCPFVRFPISLLGFQSLVISCFQVAIWLKYRQSDVNSQHNQQIIAMVSCIWL